MSFFISRALLSRIDVSIRVKSATESSAQSSNFHVCYYVRLKSNFENKIKKTLEVLLIGTCAGFEAFKDPGIGYVVFAACKRFAWRSPVIRMLKAHKKSSDIARTRNSAKGNKRRGRAETSKSGRHTLHRCRPHHVAGATLDSRANGFVQCIYI